MYNITLNTKTDLQLKNQENFAYYNFVFDAYSHS